MWLLSSIPNCLRSAKSPDFARFVECAVSDFATFVECEVSDFTRFVECEVSDFTRFMECEVSDLAAARFWPRVPAAKPIGLHSERVPRAFTAGGCRQPVGAFN
jgi:hypothetical protein